MATAAPVGTDFETSRRSRHAWIAAHAGHAIALLLAIVSVGGLTLASTYERETANWAAQALAQDWFNLCVAAPCLAISTLLASRGSRRAQIVLAGLLLFTVYTLTIYCFAVHLNRLFLVYCATLGAALYLLIGLATTLLPKGSSTWLDEGVPRRTVGAVLIAIGVAFGALWLAQLIPAARTGMPPRELVETGLFTNPIHVLDLSFILPLHMIAGVALWRRRPVGFVLASALLAFDTLMAGSIAFLVIHLDVHGVTSGGAPVAIVLAALSAISATLLVEMLRKGKFTTAR